tara:strand:- start:133 stop:660 length:528 start_codon:yes stop_codon:yes gene_type:complete
MIPYISFIIVLVSPLLSQIDMREDIISSDFYYKSGIKYSSSGNYKKAMESLKKSIEISSDNPDAYRELGTVYKLQGNYTKSIESFKKSISLNPDSDQSYYGLGVVYHDQGNYNKAIALYKRAVELNPKNPNCHFNLGMIYHNSNFEEAIYYYNKAAELGNIESKKWLLKNGHLAR